MNNDLMRYKLKWNISSLDMYTNIKWNKSLDNCFNNIINVLGNIKSFYNKIQNIFFYHFFFFQLFNMEF